jgi:hypothetical protein
VQFEELRYVCQEAAVDVLSRRGRPVPATIVLPGPERTRLVTLPDFPPDDETRHAVLAQLAADEVTPNEIPCWGFVAEAEVSGEDAVVVAFGARRNAPHVTASRFDEEGGLEEFVPSEPLDPTALPFLHPLQHAVDALTAVQGPGTGNEPDRDDPLGIARPTGEGGTLPLHPE